MSPLRRLLAFGNIRRFGNSSLANHCSAIKQNHASMWRLLAFRNIGRVGNSSLANHCSAIKQNQLLAGCSGERLFTFYKANRNRYNTTTNNFFSCSRRNYMTHRTQVALERISQSYSRHINMFVYTASWALTRYYLIPSGIYGFIMEKFIRSQTAPLIDYDSTRRVGNLSMQLNSGIEWNVLYRCLRFVGLTALVSLGIYYFHMIKRVLYLVYLFSPTLVSAPWADSYGVEHKKLWLRSFRVALEKAGSGFILWGQWAATRPDIFPRDLCLELSNIQTKRPEQSFSCTEKAIMKAFNCKLHELFDDFEKAPLASGVVTQVHRATLKDKSGGKQIKPTVVAVKIRHPDIMDSMERDLKIIKSFPRIKNCMLDRHVQNFEEYMNSQLDLVSRAKHLSRFSDRFRKSKFATFTKPILVHPTVLVETYEQGKSVTCYNEASNATRTYIILCVTEALLKMIMVHQSIHAGMHPENIVVRKKFAVSHVTFLDVGMTAELSNDETFFVRKLVRGVYYNYGYNAAIYALESSENQTCPFPDAFIEDVEKAFASWKTEEVRVDCLERMYRLFEIMRYHKVDMDENVRLGVTTVMALQAWQQKMYNYSSYKIMHRLSRYFGSELFRSW